MHQTHTILISNTEFGRDNEVIVKKIIKGEIAKSKRSITQMKFKFSLTTQIMSTL